MENQRFYSAFDDLAFWLIWLPALVVFVPVFLVSAAMVLPIAFVGNLAYRVFDHVGTELRRV